MARIEITAPGERVVQEFTALVKQPTTPSTAPPAEIGLVEISQSQPTELIPGPVGPQGPRGSRWTTGSGDPTGTGALLGDMYLDDVSGAVWSWDGTAWVNTGTNIQGSPDTPAQVLAKIVTVDGAGSGLDADLLDGHDTPYFLDYGNFTNKPATFPPSTHTHPESDVTNLVSDLALKAPLASPTFTGDPKSVTPATADNDTSIATTAYVKANLATIVGGAIISDTAPSSPQAGQLWYESDTGDTFIWMTDADSSQWVQQNIQPTGQAPETLQSVSADMSIGFKTSGNRFVVNDKSDLTGTDVMTVSETGAFTAAGTVTSSQMFSSSGANVILGGAAGVYLRPNGVSDATNQTVINSSGVMSTGSIVSANSLFTGATTSVILSPTSAGTVYLRPNPGSGTGQTTIDSAGSLTAVGNVTAGANFIGSAGNAFLNTTGAATIGLRPNGAGVTTGQTLIDSAGNMTVTGNVTSINAIFAGSTTVAVFGPATGAGGTIYLRPGGPGITTGQTTIASSGDMTIFNPASATGANIGVTIAASVGRIDTSKNVNTAQTHHFFYTPSGSAGYIQTTNATTTYATTSDASLKTVHGDYDPQEAIAIIRADPVQSFTWKVGDGGDAIGWVAQSSYAVHPDLAVPPENLDKEGEDRWGIDYGRRTPYLWAAVTALLDEVESLKAKVAALEAAP